MPLSILSNIAREAPLGSLELPSPADDCGGASRAVCFDKLHSGRTFRCEWQASLHPPYQWLSKKLDTLRTSRCTSCTTIVPRPWRAANAASKDAGHRAPGLRLVDAAPAVPT